MSALVVATCQFPVDGDIEVNLRHILRQMKRARAEGADIAHFSESALSGYLGVDLPSVRELDFDRLVSATQEIQQAARELKLWVLLGSTHQLSGRHRPHNSVYVINAAGEIVDRYDKRFCTGQAGRRRTHDLTHYSPGNRAVTFTLKGMTCGVLICYDYRFPELYRDYKQRGVEVLFQSFHNARASVVADESYNIWKHIVPATMSCRAAENHMWISANNSTTRPSRWASFFVRPDGWITGRLKLHQPGVLVSRVQRDPTLFDAPGPWRAAAMSGQLHSGELIDDPRSSDVTCL